MKTFLKKYQYPCLLTLLTVFGLFLMVPSDSLFGSEGDWLSQHVPVAEQFRQLFYQTGRIFPDYSLLGAGSNIYDFSYYGFLRPDVLFSYLLPGVPMAYILSGYAVLELIASANLCYFWLKRQVSLPFFAFLGAFLFSCAGCFAQFHHQIMFINYMPFLLLALLGIDRMLEKHKAGLLILSLFLVYLHSYYFSIAVLAVLLLYFLYRLSGKSPESFGTWKAFLRSMVPFAGAVALSIGMAAILLIPTGLDLLSTSKDAGAPVSPADIFSFSLSMDSLLYSSYSCGLTIVCLYTLLHSIRRKCTRIFSIVILLALTLNVIPYLFSGLLYIRYKVLIPLIPLLILLCAITLEEIHRKKEKPSIIFALCCLVPLFFCRHPIILAADFALLSVFLLLGRFGNGKAALSRHIILCLLPAISIVYAGRQEEWVSRSDNRQAVFTRDELDALNLDSSYRFDYLSSPFANANVQQKPDLGRTTMYSSVTNSEYAKYFYDIAQNPIRVRNRVALLTDANPFFSYLMGIRYIQTPASYLPAGYHVIAQKGKNVIAENPNVLPVAYTSTNLISRAAYDKLDFPYNLEVLARNTVVPDDGDISRTQFPDADASAIRPVLLESLFSPETLQQAVESQKDFSFTPQTDGYMLSVKKDISVTVPLKTALNGQILILSFRVDAPSGDEVLISINGTRNKLSGRDAPYPNNNTDFTYLISSAEKLERLTFTFSRGDYSISGIQSALLGEEVLKNSGVTPFSFDAAPGKAILKGTARLEQDGYFVTSLPYRPGYEAYRDGKPVQTLNINDGFIGFPLEAGSHEISLYYHPPGKTPAVYISLLSWIGFLAFMALQKVTVTKRRNIV